MIGFCGVMGITLALRCILQSDAFSSPGMESMLNIVHVVGGAIVEGQVLGGHRSSACLHACRAHYIACTLVCPAFWTVLSQRSGDLLDAQPN